MARTIGALAALGAVLTLSACSDDEPRRDPEGNVTESADAADVFDVRVGDCVGAFEDGDEVTEIPVLPCDQSHDQEVYARFELADAEAFPGKEELNKQANEKCLQEFQAFVGVPYNDSELYVEFLTPSEDSWDDGDREVLCTVYDPAGPTEGTLKAAKR